MKKCNGVALVDVDGTIADLETPWLKWIQENYYPDLKKFTQWDIHNQVNGDRRVYDYLNDPHVYEDVLPIEGSVFGIHTLKEHGYSVYFHTSCGLAHAYAKYHWLQRWGFPVTLDNYVEIRDKSVLTGSLIIDDGVHNLTASDVIVKILHVRDWNVDALNNENFISMFSWYDLPHILERLQALKVYV